MKVLLACMIVVFLAPGLIAQIPDFEVKNLEQEWVSLSDYKGEKLTVVDFWATWCKPCVTAIPKLNSLYKEFGDKGVAFVGINVDGPRNQSKVKPFINSLKVKYPQILDPDQDLVNEMNVSVFPTLMVFNKYGKEVFVHEGFNPGDEELIKGELEKILKNED